MVKNAIAAHSINPDNIEAEIRKKLLPQYFDKLGGLDKAKELIEQIVHIVRVGKIKNQ